MIDSISKPVTGLDDVWCFFVGPQSVEELLEDPKVREIYSSSWDISRFEQLDRAEWYIILAFVFYELAERDLEIAKSHFQNCMKREAACSTGIGHGYGCPHFYSTHVGRLQFSVIYLPEGSSFGSLDEEKTDLLFLRTIPREWMGNPRRYQVLMAKMIMEPHFLKFLRQSKNAEEMWEVVEECAREVASKS
jgi:mannitol/fructose-specific phosphotransferase system IIA component (Ntr-type)